MAADERHYLAYGARISSDITLPELKPAAPDDRTRDVVLRFADRRALFAGDLRWVTRLEDERGEPWLCCAATRTGYLVRFPGIADFHVRRDGGEIVCCSTSLDLDDSDLRHLVLDQVMPLAVKLRGFEPLHATAIRTPAGVCAFVGPSGAGKSTLAAGFLAAGYAVISDDCLPVYVRGDEILVVPAYPGVRLHEDTFEAVSRAGGLATRPGARTAKRRWTPEGGIETFPLDHQPLRRIYRLTGQDEERRRRIEAVPRREAFIEMIRSTFRFDDSDRDALCREFRMWEQVVRAVAMRRLWVGDDLLAVAAREAVLADVSAA